MGFAVVAEGVIEAFVLFDEALGVGEDGLVAVAVIT